MTGSRRATCWSSWTDEDAKARLESTEARIDRLKAAIKSAEADLKKAEAESEGFENLKQLGFSSETELRDVGDDTWKR